MNNRIKIFILVIVLLILGTVVLAMTSDRGDVGAPGKYDQFAQCLEEKGAVFYGAFWCPHCQAQKKMFGTSHKFLPYVECSTADGNGQTQACIDKGISSYPTWEFADGSLLKGEVDLVTLAEKTSCILPE